MKTELLDFTRWFLKNKTGNYDPKNLAESIVDLYLKSKDSDAQSESRSVSDNEDKTEVCCGTCYYIDKINEFCLECKNYSHYHAAN